MIIQLFAVAYDNNQQHFNSAMHIILTHGMHSVITRLKESKENEIN